MPSPDVQMPPSSSSPIHVRFHGTPPCVLPVSSGSQSQSSNVVLPLVQAVADSFGAEDPDSFGAEDPDSIAREEGAVADSFGAEDPENPDGYTMGSVMDDSRSRTPPRGPRVPLLLEYIMQQEHLMMCQGQVPQPSQNAGAHTGDSSLPGQAFSVGAAFRDSLVGRGQGSPEGMFCAGGHADVEQCLHHCNQCVQEVVESGATFYIGITENLERRQEEHFGPRSCWTRIICLAYATSSRVTASLERTLVDRWRGHLRCQNVGDGGGHASAGSPHFLYLLVNDGGLIRRGASDTRRFGPWD